ncbi:hypothetical protein PMIN07_007029 [Paraphaeosphaeria minitans]
MKFPDATKQIQSSSVPRRFSQLALQPTSASTLPWASFTVDHQPLPKNSRALSHSLSHSSPWFGLSINAFTARGAAHLHVSAIGFAAAFGKAGAAIIPSGVGALAQSRGVTILQPIILAILAFSLLMWLHIPAIGKASPGSSQEERKSWQWINIDYDLVDAGKRTIQKATSGMSRGVVQLSAHPLVAELEPASSVADEPVRQGDRQTNAEH